jgi:hypothetical protein
VNRIRIIRQEAVPQTGSFEVFIQNEPGRLSGQRTSSAPWRRSYMQHSFGLPLEFWGSQSRIFAVVELTRSSQENELDDAAGCRPKQNPRALIAG